MKLEKVFLPSAIRRGRASTDPTWFVTLDDGTKQRFMRKRDAVAFMEQFAPRTTQATPASEQEKKGQGA